MKKPVQAPDAAPEPTPAEGPGNSFANRPARSGGSHVFDESTQTLTPVAPPAPTAPAETAKES